MNDLAKTAVATLIASVVAVGWGLSYRNAHPMQGVGAFFGYTDPTYSLAGWAIGLGIPIFLIGLALLIAGIVRGRSTDSSAR
jgi:hypothetical protein